jgi:hypothetical protein
MISLATLIGASGLGQANVNRRPCGIRSFMAKLIIS